MHKGITEHRTITEYRDEELVRAYLLTKLVNELGYPADRIEIEKQYEAGRPNTITSRIDVIVKDKNDNAFLFIEVKHRMHKQKTQKMKLSKSNYLI